MRIAFVAFKQGLLPPIERMTLRYFFEYVATASVVLAFNTLTSLDCLYVIKHIVNRQVIAIFEVEALVTPVVL